MGIKYTKLTRINLRQLQPGQRITEHGITFTRLQNGDGRWTINLMVDGRRIHRVVGTEASGVTREHVEVFTEKIRTEARENRLRLPKGRKLAINFEEAAKRYIARLEEEGGKELEKKKRRLELHLTPYFTKMPLSQLSSFEIEKYKKHRKEAGAKPATINRELAVLSHLLNKVLEWGWLDNKPCKIKMLREDNARITYLTVEQAERLLKAAKKDTNPQIYLFILIGLETAMRRSEILNIRIENIKPEQYSLYIPKAKAGARVQPITPRLAETLAKHIKTRRLSEGWLFPSIGNAPSKAGHTTYMEEPFRRVVKAAGLNPKEVTIHILRHTATTQLIQSGIDIPTVQCITGHKTPSMVHRYSHQNGAHIQQAMETLQRRYDSARSSEQITQELHTPSDQGKKQSAETGSKSSKAGKHKKYPQGNSNPCRLREREVS